LGNPNRKTDNV